MKKALKPLAVVALIGLLSCASSPTAHAQFSLSANFDNATLRIGSNVNGNVTLMIQQDSEGENTAAGGVTVSAGDSVSFDSNGTLASQTAGFWTGMKGADPYVVCLNTADTESPSPQPAQRDIPVQYDSSGTLVAGNMPFVLETVSTPLERTAGRWELKERPSYRTAAIMAIRGPVRWDTDRVPTQAPDVDVFWTPGTGEQSHSFQSHRISYRIMKGTLFVRLLDSSEYYKINNLSPDFTATISGPFPTQGRPSQ